MNVLHVRSTRIYFKKKVPPRDSKAVQMAGIAPVSAGTADGMSVEPQVPELGEAAAESTAQVARRCRQPGAGAQYSLAPSRLNVCLNAASVSVGVESESETQRHLQFILWHAFSWSFYPISRRFATQVTVGQRPTLLEHLLSSGWCAGSCSREGGG